VATSLLSAAAAAHGATHTNWAAIVVAIIGSGLAGTVVGGLLTQRRELAAARRERYAAASRLLAARVEYPYRIRRRTSDAAETLDALAARGHDLQEQLADAHAWVTAECDDLGDLYASTLKCIDEQVASACQQAWQAKPVTTAAGMNVGDFGPRGCQALITRFECSTAWRFGWRRVTPRSLLRRRLGTSEPQSTSP
jgi:hypothetical protein